MSILIYNTFSGKKEIFKPINENIVTLYVCGITPYDEVHLGHARAYVTFDIIRRHLENSNYTVKHVQNFTDIDDKIIKRSQEKGISPITLAQTYINDYFTNMDKLYVKRANNYPKVTENINQIIKFVENLIKKGMAYSVPTGDVYFSIRKFKNYGKLSKRNINELISGARIEIDEQKDSPLDFALWKSSKPTEPAEVCWDSPWGKGRPGWHIECSVMSTNNLGPTIDIHGGGQDLIFPHHENEIAQSEGATDKQFVRYWVHNGFVTINKEKMSKSLGNFFTLREIFEKYQPRIVRYFLLSQHYRSPLDFSDDKLTASANALKGIDEVLQKIPICPGNEDNIQVLENIVSDFKNALNDDFNTEKALSVIHILKKDALSFITQNNIQMLYRIRKTFTLLLKEYLGIDIETTVEISNEVIELKTERENARKEKNWAKSDEIRKKLDTLGYKIQDNSDNTSILIKKNF